jgi:hypothetical protein
MLWKRRYNPIRVAIPLRLRLAWTVGTILELSVVGVLVYVAGHFISKFW